MKRTTRSRRGRVRRGLSRGALLASATALAALAVAAPASASISINSFSITPSTAQAGAAPNLNVVANFGSQGSDTVNDMRLSFAPGLLANPTVPNTCSTLAFSLDLCPLGSWIGTGTVTGTIPSLFGFTAPFGANVYLVTPASSSDVARIGLIINVFGVPIQSALAPVSVRTGSGDVGLNFDFSGLPNREAGLPLVLDNLNLTIFGRANGQTFTRNPTSCGTATSRLYALSYGSPSSIQSATSSFTPTGCGTVSYAPKLSASAALDGADAGVAYTVKVDASPTDAATHSLTLTTPPSLSPSILAAAAACTLPVIGSCPTIGTATATTPFLGAPLKGNVVLVGHPGALPTLAIMFSSPVPLELDGTVSLGGTPLTLSTTLTNLPDIPLTDLTVTFNGGPGSLFLALPSALCTPPQTTSAMFSGANGATVTQSAATTITGCPALTLAAPALTTTTGATVTKASQLVTPANAADAAAETAAAKAALATSRTSAHRSSRTTRHHAGSRSGRRHATSAHRVRSHRVRM